MSERTESTEPSTSTAWSETAGKLWRSCVAPELLETASSGEIDLATGSPPFPVNPEVKNAITAKVGEIEHLAYPPANGAANLRKEIADFDQC
jgi:aspartate/methionine/tyrosine aminotransferase